MDINIYFEGNFIKQHDTIQYLGCSLDAKLSREAMPSKVQNSCQTKIPV